MKMKMKRLFAVIMAMAMVVAIATGCSKKSAGKSSGNSVSGDCATITMSIKYEGEKGAIDESVVSKGSGNEVSLSISGKADIEGNTINFNANDMLVVADNKLYVNVKAIVDAISNVDDEDAKEVVAVINNIVNQDYVYLDMKSVGDMTQNVDVNAFTKVIDDLMTAYKDLSTGSDNKVEIKISSSEDAKKFVEATAKFINDNAEKYTDMIYEYVSKVDMKKVVDMVLDEVVDYVTKSYESQGMTVTDEQKKLLKDTVASQMGETENMIPSKEDILESIKEVADELNDSVKDIEVLESDDTKYELVIEKSEAGYSVYAKAEDSENKLEISGSFDTATPVKVTAPSKAQNVEDIISSVMALYGSNMLD